MEEPQSEPAWGDDRSLKTAASLRAIRDQADQTLEGHRQRVSEVEARLNEQIQQMSHELAGEQLADEQAMAASLEQVAMLDQLRHALSEKEAEVEELLDQLTTNTLDFEAHSAERDEELEQLLELSDDENRQRTTLQQELESARQALEELRLQECAACVQAHAELTAVGQQFNELDERFCALQAQHQSQQAELDEAQHASQSVQALSEQSAAALADAEQRLAELSKFKQESQQNEEQLKQARRKFELALADVHKLKRENAELHEELLSRPEANDQESPELVSLRAERDALAQRIAELESAPAPTPTADDQQELADLQSRFEMAVDDLRQLKQANDDLRQRLASANTDPVDSCDEEAEDWQAQKARLLATLDAEDRGKISEARRAERATIEGTISITDRVVAERDAQLAEKETAISDLQRQLEARPAGLDLDELRDQIAAEILGDDEAVQAECEKLRQQQQELDAKRREAELEISVQRATLARQQAALQEKLAKLPEAEVGREKPSGDKPRRRWLSALGLKDEDQG